MIPARSAHRWRGSWAAVPLRAAKDRRLKEAHLRLLMVIAWHGRSGAGCWALQPTLAKETGLHVTTVAEAITALREWGYVAARISPRDRRRRIYSIVPDATNDSAPMGVEGHIERASATENAPGIEGVVRFGEVAAGLIARQRFSR